MILKKKAETFNTYTLELSWGQLETIVQALQTNHADAISDETFAEIQWYMERVPGPGEEEEDTKAREQAAAGAEEDFPVPMPPGQQTAAPEGEQPPADATTPLSNTEKEALSQGGETPEDELPELPREGAEALPDVSEEPQESDEADRRLPEPPRE